MNRSYLFIPGNTPAMIQNADVFESDAVILDLEDSVTIEDKDAARQLLHSFLQSYQLDVSIYIRLNDANSPLFLEDIQYLDSLSVSGFVVPKITVDQLLIIEEHTKKDLICIIETPMGFLQAERIASHNQVKGLLLGAEDFTKEMNVKRSIEGLEIDYVRAHLAIVCRAYNIESIDTPYTAKDMTFLREDCKKARRLGFTGKASIHPNHVDTILEVFSPSQEEISQALRIIKKAEQTKKGAFSLDGKMIDAPIIEKAKQVIALAQQYKLL
jgi:citrate lyase subunit beta/citryl-CoA lyase